MARIKQSWSLGLRLEGPMKKFVVGVFKEEKGRAYQILAQGSGFEVPAPSQQGTRQRHVSRELCGINSVISRLQEARLRSCFGLSTEGFLRKDGIEGLQG